jgi:hypothetical protein
MHTLRVASHRCDMHQQGHKRVCSVQCMLAHPSCMRCAVMAQQRVLRLDLQLAGHSGKVHQQGHKAVPCTLECAQCSACMLAHTRHHPDAAAAATRHWLSTLGSCHALLFPPAAFACRCCCFCICLYCPPCVQHLDEWGYLMVGLAAALPCVAVPLLLPNKVCAGTDTIW